MSSTADAVAETAVGPRFFREDMPIEQLRRSPLNPRKHFDPAGLEELATSIRELGVIEPLVARQVDDHYEIVAGERRWRSAELAGLASVPVIVKPLTDAQALEIMVVENNQREDVSALEQSEGLRQLLQTGYDLGKLAERLGRSKKYIYDRIKLLDLVPSAKELLVEQRLTAGHAILLARLKPADQERAIDPHDGGAFKTDHGARGAVTLDEEPEDEYDEVKPASVRELDRWIAEHVRFDVQHAAAAAPLEYGEAGGQVAAATAKPGRGKKVIAITFEHYISPDARDSAERTFGPRSFKLADGRTHDEGYGDSFVAPECEHSVLGVVAAGARHYGRTFTVCIARDKCDTHWKRELAERKKNQKLRDSGQAAKANKHEAAARAREDREAEERAANERRRELVQARAIDQAVAGVTSLTPDVQRAILLRLVNGDMDHHAFNERFKTNVRWNCRASAVKSLSGRVLVQALVFAVVSEAQCVGDFAEAVGMFGVDLKKVTAAVEREEAKASAAAPKAAVQTSAKSKAKKKR